jgi:hypothetical protein
MQDGAGRCPAAAVFPAVDMETVSRLTARCGRAAYYPACGRYSCAAISRMSFLRMASAKVS